MSKANKSPPIDMVEVNKVLKSLKVGKSRDPENYICDIFKEGVIGTDLKLSLLMMFNKMKDEGQIPEALRTANITSLHKKNNKLDLNNWRGIFVTSVLRTILMKIIHERAYEIVASTMTDSQIGARKGKSVRNHIFVLNSIISDVMSSVKKVPIDLNIMDFSQMFDSEELFVTLNSLYEAGITSDILPVIYEANKMNYIAVKTPGGLTERKSISNKIMQGDVLGPLVSSNMVDKYVGERAMETGQIYMYKNKVKIPPLVMQDDILSISECGFKSRKRN